MTVKIFSVILVQEEILFFTSDLTEYLFQIQIIKWKQTLEIWWSEVRIPVQVEIFS